MPTAADRTSMLLRSDVADRPLFGQIHGMQRLDFLDGLRALAALWVVHAHIVTTVWNSNVPPPQGGWLFYLDWIPSAHFAVTVFIVLSGFCLMMPVIRAGGRLSGGTVGFLRRRAFRILPPYFLTLLISLALIHICLNQKTGTVWDCAIPVTGGGLLAHVFLVHNVTVHTSQVNYPLWSIAVESQIYLLFPLLLISWRKIGPLKTLAITLVVTYPLVYIFRHSPLSGFTFHYLAAFGLGMLAAAVAYESNPRWQWMRRWRRQLGLFAALIVCIGILMCGRLGRYDVNRYSAYLDFPAAVATALLLIMLATSSDGRVARFLEMRWLVRIGQFSFTVYLIHSLPLQLLWQEIVQPLAAPVWANYLLLTGPGLALIVLISHLVFLAIERPFTRRPSAARLIESSSASHEAPLPAV
jgi:peptidoglycan/LPS O-acetylase OafA/YrhL